MFHQIGVGSLGQHEYHGLYLLELGAVLVPEIGGDFSGHVAAEAVDIGFAEPELHGVSHCGTHLRVGVVELIHVGPVVGAEHLALLVAGIPVRMVLHPCIVTTGVVRNPVDNHFHAGIVCGAHHLAEVVD